MFECQFVCRSVLSVSGEGVGSVALCTQFSGSTLGLLVKKRSAILISCCAYSCVTSTNEITSKSAKKGKKKIVRFPLFLNQYVDCPPCLPEYTTVVANYAVLFLMKEVLPTVERCMVGTAGVGSHPKSHLLLGADIKRCGKGKIV